MFGIYAQPWWGYIAITLVMTHITVLGVTIYLHRCQAHRAVQLHPIVSHFFRFWLWLTTGMVTKEWVAIHRKHHRYTEMSGDPHSPKIYNVTNVLFQGAELYRDASKDQDMIEEYSYGTPDDAMERLYQRYHSKGVLLMLLVNMVLFGIPGLAMWTVQMMWIPFFAAGVVNGLGHYWGYRNYETQDASTNLVPFGILLAGEELHNNHHAHASSARFSSRWWEIDVAWGYLRVLSFFGLAKICKLAPKLKKCSGKGSIDLQTVQALNQGRMQVWTDYYHHVIQPTLKVAKREVDKKTRPLFKRAGKLFVRDKSLMSAGSIDRLEALLQAREPLRLVYAFGEQLQAIWQSKHASQQDFLKSLEEWCDKAESSDSCFLKRFVQYLKELSLIPATA